MVKLSILDQVPISEGQSSEQALQNTIELSKLADSLGYHRYWIAEHHSTKYFANASPEVLISTLASQTSKIKLGTGGVLLQHYSPFKVAESLKLLSVLYPNRIDAGFGRTAGGDDKATIALQGDLNSPSTYEDKVKMVVEYLNQDINSKNYDIIVSPHSTYRPEIWLLGSGIKSAEIAAKNGLSFAFGHFLTPDEGGSALKTYLDKFNNSINQSKSKASICINIICAETLEKCEYIAKSHDIMTVLFHRGIDLTGTPNPEKYNLTLTNEEIELVNKNRQELILGTPNEIMKKILNLCKDYQVDEVMILTIAYNHNDRMNSYKLIMEEMNKQSINNVELHYS